MPTDRLATLAAAGFDIAHAFDARAMASQPGWEMLADEPPLGLLIGNTRRLWPRFCEAMRDPEMAQRTDPLDHYTEVAIAHSFGDARVYYSHRRYGEMFLPFQKLAVATGLGALSDGGLVIHPIYGPWLALRAVILVDGAPIARAPIPKPCACDGTCPAALATALADGADWRAWLAVRDGCALRDWRYDDHQIRYHYTKVWEP